MRKIVIMTVLTFIVLCGCVPLPDGDNTQIPWDKITREPAQAGLIGSYSAEFMTLGTQSNNWTESGSWKSEEELDRDSIPLKTLCFPMGFVSARITESDGYSWRVVKYDGRDCISFEKEEEE